MAELMWFKSSHSGDYSAACVEIAWRKSTYSGKEDYYCVEVAKTTTAVLVRDSKDKTGPRLTFSPDAWRAFLDLARTL
ncbi:DUF397 domain-containing protein [Kitasatospora sp. NPDC093558]|uniref:DUF397 domain-containing protein n=1 Tax=Kitasatospora sp. NPDC093558 TaxID=3155201 RepID=UPI00343E5DAA